MKNNPYVGKIGHGGTQVIKVPQPAEKRGNIVKKTDSDLRTGKSGK